jgi:hypothetical protein
LYTSRTVVVATLSAAVKQWAGMIKDRKESPQEG